MDEAIEKSAMRKIYLRLLPFAILVIHSGLHRSHQCQLRWPDDARRSQAISDRVRLCAGNILPGLFIFEVPSNVIMEKVGARLWIARIMITWGIVRRPHGVRVRHDELLHRQVPARCR